MWCYRPWSVEEPLEDAAEQEGPDEGGARLDLGALPGALLAGRGRLRGAGAGGTARAPGGRGGRRGRIGVPAHAGGGDARAREPALRGLVAQARGLPGLVTGALGLRLGALGALGRLA